jgi:Zn-dependent M28 family amino/carboxypeptidase
LLLSPPPKGSVTVAFKALSQTARDKGAAMVFILIDGSPEEFDALVSRIKSFTASGRLSLQKPDSIEADMSIFMVRPVVAEKIFAVTLDRLKKAVVDPGKKSLGKIKPGKISYQVAVHSSTVKAENVLGYLEGTDKKDEVLVITAHYDHIGISGTGADRINNGADDDGSGTVSVLEIAKTMALAKKEGHGPRRSILFMTVVAEEQGLLGSQYYSEHPVYPLANTVVDLNIDMIGRTDPEHRDSIRYVYVIGSDKLSTELHQLSEKTNAVYTKLRFDYTYNDENHPSNLYKRSDHWNFAKHGIPVIFYFDGIHEDYHRPGDDVSKIDFDLLALRARCVFYTAWEIVNREQRIAVDRK